MGRQRRFQQKHSAYHTDYVPDYEPSQHEDDKFDNSDKGFGDKQEVEHLTMMEQMMLRLNKVLKNQQASKPAVNIKEGVGGDDEDTITPKRLGSKTKKDPPIPSRNGFTRNQDING